MRDLAIDSLMARAKDSIAKSSMVVDRLKGSLTNTGSDLANNAGDAISNAGETLGGVADRIKQSLGRGPVSMSGAEASASIEALIERMTALHDLIALNGKAIQMLESRLDTLEAKLATEPV